MLVFFIVFTVNNAGFGWVGAAENHPSGNLANMFATNVHGPIMLTQKLLPHWKKAKRGHVITVTSIAGIMGFPFSASYVATKFAIEGFTETLAMELCDFENIQYVILFSSHVFLLNQLK